MRNFPAGEAAALCLNLAAPARGSLATLSLPLGATARTIAMNPSMRVTEVLESALYVTDLVAAQQFYTEVLGLSLYSKMEGRHVFLRCGDRMVLLFNPEATAVSAGGRNDAPVHGARGPGHLAFAVREREIERWKSHLAQHGVEIEKEIRLKGSRAIYFRDPAQNSIEITSPMLWGISEETHFSCR